MELLGSAVSWPRKRCGLQFLFLLTVAIKTLESSKMKITGNVTVSNLKEGVSLAKESYLSVKFQDVSLMDAASVVLGTQEQMFAERTKVGPGTEPLNYTIVCDKPEEIHRSYSVSAVLNVGWKPHDDKEWIRNGDFLSDTSHPVEITQESDHFVVDIEMIHYSN